jgi:hypothetical protein
MHGRPLLTSRFFAHICPHFSPIFLGGLKIQKNKTNKICSQSTKIPSVDFCEGKKPTVKMSPLDMSRLCAGA